MNIMKIFWSLILIFFSTALIADDHHRDAQLIFQRLNGVPPSEEVLNEMVAALQAGNREAAAEIAVGQKTFINIKAKHFAKKFFDPEANKSFKESLGDGAATIMGMIKDDVPFNKLLSEDIVYSLQGLENNLPAPDLRPATLQQNLSNADENQADFSTRLVKSESSKYTGLETSVSAGLFTTSSFGFIGLEAGTNRAAIQWIINEMFCKELGEVADNTRDARYIGNDVFRRNEGDINGNPTVFDNYCKSCHTGIDGMRGAFAYMDYNKANSRLIYDPSKVHDKYLHNADNNHLGDGFVNTSDAWVNLYTQGVTKNWGWPGNLTGFGPKSLGTSLTQSGAFSKCMSRRVFEEVCLNKPQSNEDKALVSQLGKYFETTGGYKMKDLFVKMASKASCLKVTSSDDEGSQQ